MRNQNIVHKDIHLGNIITNLKDTKLIDLDEGDKISNNGFYEQLRDIRNLLLVILSVLYDIDIVDYLDKSQIEDFLSVINLSHDFKEYINDQYYCSFDINKLIYPNIFLDSIDYEQVEYDKKKLSK